MNTEDDYEQMEKAELQEPTADKMFENGLTEEETPRLTCKDTNPKDACGTAKPNYANVPTQVLYEVGAAMYEGARKYGAYNFRVAGVRMSVYLDAARRHLDAFREGEDLDPDSNINHITKAIAGLIVLRDAMLNDKVTDDRPPRAADRDWMSSAQELVDQIVARHPDPIAPYTQEMLAHLETGPIVGTHEGALLGYEVRVQIPNDSAPEGVTWFTQGEELRASLEHALAVAQALREDGYGERVIQVVRHFEHVEEYDDGALMANGRRTAVERTIFPGDPTIDGAAPSGAPEIAGLLEASCEAVAEQGEEHEPDYDCPECKGTGWYTPYDEHERGWPCSDCTPEPADLED